MKKIYALVVCFTAVLSVKAQCPTGELSFSAQAQIDNFIIQYPDCTLIDGDIIITGNSIVNLNGLQNLVSVTGALEIRNNPALTNLSGLQNLQSVGTDLIIRSNATLQSISQLSGITTVGGEFTVRTCNALTSLNGMQNLTSVGLALIIRDCTLLTSIEALSGITFVGETLEIVENPALVSLNGLQNIQTITGGEEGAIFIEANDLLTSLAGLGNNGTQINGDVTITLNNLLAFCAVPSICNYLQNPPTGAVTTINSNISGCNSVTEVENECAILDVERVIAEKTAFKILSNPVSHTLMIHNSSTQEAVAVVYDIYGQKVTTGTLKHGITSLPLYVASGIYVVNIAQGQQHSFYKIIKK